MRVMKMAMGFVRCMSTRWRDFGLSCVRGCVPIEASLKKSYPCTWAFSSLFTMPKSEGFALLSALLETLLT